jgi:hypothetical protein
MHTVQGLKYNLCPWSLSVGSVAGHWLFSRRRWLNPRDDDDRRALEEGYHRLCSMLSAFQACPLSTFLQVLARTAESWARRASECWANQKIVVIFQRPGGTQSIADHICNLEPAHVSALRDAVTVETAAALDRSPHQQRDWLADSDCDASGSDASSTDMGTTSSAQCAGDCISGPEDAVALQLLEYTRSTAAAVADAQQPGGTAGDMDAVLESLPRWSADADEEEWAWNPSN